MAHWLAGLFYLIMNSYIVLEHRDNVDNSTHIFSAKLLPHFLTCVKVLLHTVTGMVV